MKIAIVCPNDFTVVTYCGALVRLLQDNGENTVSAVCDVHNEKPGAYYASILTTWGVRHLSVKYYRFLSVRRDAAYLWSLFKILRRERFDLVMNIAPKPNVYGSIAARLAGTSRIVCSVWGLGVTFGEDRGLRGKLLRGIALGLYWIAFRASTKVWFTNECDYQSFIDDGIVSPQKAFLTKFFVNTEAYSPRSVTPSEIRELRKEFGLGDAEKVVVMVARMSWAKGVREFVEAAAIMREEGTMARFILVGPRDEGSSDSVPESYLRDNARFSNFIWTGFRNDVQAFYAVSDVAVLPSYYREGGYPKGLTEAMCMGKPIVTTDSVHCRATVEHGKNGYHVPIRDSRALAEAIKLIITDDERRDQFGRYSRAKALNEFDEDKVVAEVVRQVLSSTPILPNRLRYERA